MLKLTQEIGRRISTIRLFKELSLLRRIKLKLKKNRPKFLSGLFFTLAFQLKNTFVVVIL